MDTNDARLVKLVAKRVAAACVSIATRARWYRRMGLGTRWCGGRLAYNVSMSPLLLLYVVCLTFRYPPLQSGGRVPLVNRR